MKPQWRRTLTTPPSGATTPPVSAKPTAANTTGPAAPPTANGGAANPFLTQAKADIADKARILRHTAFVFQPNEQLMASLLEQVKKVDFRALAGFDPTDEDAKLKVSDYHVLVSQQILELTKRNQWNICRRHDFFYFYNGSFWQVVNHDDLRRFLGEAAERMGIAWLKARSVDFTKKLFEQFSETAYIPAPVVDEHRVKINLQNGTFEISADRQILRAPNPADLLMHQLPFAYDPTATAPQFQTFLNRVQPDSDCQKLLAEYLGYVFINQGRLKLEKAMLLYGSGANGKSVFFEIVMGLLGKPNVSNFTLEKLTTEPAYRAQIQNKLLNYASEISGNLESTTFKALVSGEPVEARLLYGQAFTMTNYAKLLANTNELPNSPEHTHAYFRRFLIVPFNITIPEAEQDKQLADRIIQMELSGVFNWVLAGLRRLLAQGNFTPCEAVQEQLDIYKKQSDSVRLFLDESEYSVGSDRYVLLKDLYRDYRAYCLESGMPPVKKPNFQKRLNGIGIQTERRNVGNVVYVHRTDTPY
ncbi:phage/plasmid primase, P4 family [Spirosoma migulaei]